MGNANGLGRWHFPYRAPIGQRVSGPMVSLLPPTL
jgi:hypothetical protein